MSIKAIRKDIVDTINKTFDIKMSEKRIIVIASAVAVVAVGANHMLGQLATMIALGAGPVSFTHIVKAVSTGRFASLVNRDDGFHDAN